MGRPEQNPSADLPFGSFPLLTMNDNSPLYVHGSQMILARPLTLTPHASSELRLTPEESEEIKEKSRWLRRVANPFVDLYLIVAVGAAGSPTATEVQRCEDRQTRDHAKNL